MKRRSFLIGATATMATLAAPAVHAQKKTLTIGVGGKPLLYYLPLTIAEKRGFFAEEGLDVSINDFGGGARSLQALIGGSIDVVTGAFEHTIRMQAKGQDIRSVCELGRFPGIVIAVLKDRADRIKSAADLKGAKIGVTAPGSSTALTAQYAMVKAGLKASDASLIGIGGSASAIAAVKKGEVDAISHLDPVIAKLESEGDIKVIIDTRTQAGSKALFGGSNPAASVYTRKDYIDKNPAIMQGVVNAHMKALRWIASATPAQIADTVPPEYHVGDRPLYEKAFASSAESYSRTGITTMEARTGMLDMLKLLDPEFANANVDLAKTFDDQFVTKFKG